ncbi:hypothetical protein A3Q56_06968 [Intoshia linei]|uniref:Uncharacterized protein n=1 Tax=Intoshia linei TaxID=1819745 RepID=A0A177ATG7_9BILA|nr:hypothetical protein A3Q56_06968 [Intoshia linei]
MYILNYCNIYASYHNWKFKHRHDNLISNVNKPFESFKSPYEKSEKKKKLENLFFIIKPQTNCNKITFLEKKQQVFLWSNGIYGSEMCPINLKANEGQHIEIQAQNFILNQDKNLNTNDLNDPPNSVKSNYMETDFCIKLYLTEYNLLNNSAQYFKNKNNEAVSKMSSICKYKSIVSENQDMQKQIILSTSNNVKFYAKINSYSQIDHKDYDIQFFLLILVHGCKIPKNINKKHLNIIHISNDTMTIECKNSNKKLHNIHCIKNEWIGIDNIKCSKKYEETSIFAVNGSTGIALAMAIGIGILIGIFIGSISLFGAIYLMRYRKKQKNNYLMQTADPTNINLNKFVDLNGFSQKMKNKESSDYTKSSLYNEHVYEEPVESCIQCKCLLTAKNVSKISVYHP